MIDTRPASQDNAATASRIVVSTSLDDLQSSDVRFLQEAARLGNVHVRLSSDELVESRTGRPPSFPQAERLFLSRALRPVHTTSVVRRPAADALADVGYRQARFVLPTAEDDPELAARCLVRGIDYRVIGAELLSGFPPFDVEDSHAPRGVKRVVVSGCFDWLHSGHVQFFLDAATYGDLYVVVGSDQNVRLLKGPGHPFHRQDERRYMVEAVRSVHRAVIATGTGWLDAEPEIEAIAPHVYVVNEDGDQPEKRAFCRAHGLEYVVLQRRPHRDLPRRTSTELRGY